MQSGEISKSELLSILADPTQAGTNEALPDTGLSPEWEQLLSSPFVRNDEYGTRCSSLVLLEYSGALSLQERRFDSLGSPTSDTELTFHPDGW
jgi:uncharacterized protein with NRDE domain